MEASDRGAVPLLDDVVELFFSWFAIQKACTLQRTYDYDGSFSVTVSVVDGHNRLQAPREPSHQPPVPAKGSSVLALSVCLAQNRGRLEGSGSTRAILARRPGAAE